MSTESRREQIARALDEHYNPDKYPVMAAMFLDYADTVLAVMEPIIREERSAELRRAARYIGLGLHCADMTPTPQDTMRWLDRRADDIENGDG